MNKFQVWDRFERFSGKKIAVFITTGDKQPIVAEFPFSNQHDEERQMERAIRLCHILNGYLSTTITEKGREFDKMVTERAILRDQEQKLIEAERMMEQQATAESETNKLLEKVSAKSARTVKWGKLLG